MSDNKDFLMNFRDKGVNPLLVLIFYIVISVFSAVEVNGQISVKLWADDKKSAFSFTLDDCCMSQYTYAAPIFDSFNFKGTFDVITDSLTNDLPAKSRYGTWKQFDSLALRGHEIGSHSVNHPDLTAIPLGDTSTKGTLLYELYQSQKAINQKIPSQKCTILSYPNLAYDSNVVRQTSHYYEAARSGGKSPVDARLGGLEYYRIVANEELFNLPRNSTADDLDELADFKKYVDSSISMGKWGLIEIHEVVPFTQIPQLVINGEWYPMSTEWLTSLCEWIKQKSDSNLVWVETMGNIARYEHERQVFQYDFLVQTATQKTIHAYDTLNDQIYNYPLTVDINVPSGWERVVVLQGSRTDTVNTFSSLGSTYVRAHVIPDGGIITLNKISPILTLSALIEGLYNDTTMVADTVTVELHHASSPYALVDSAKGVLDTSGVGTFHFTNAINGTPYYLVIRHRNAVETWSSSANSFTSFALSYNFTTSQSQAYGNNLVLKGGKYCIFSGDVNQDGMVDASDLTSIDNDMHFDTTSHVADLNGDGIVNSSDLTIADNNNTLAVRKIAPTVAPAVKNVRNGSRKLNNN